MSVMQRSAHPEGAVQHSMLENILVTVGRSRDVKCVFGHLVEAPGSARDVDSGFVDSAEKHVEQPFGHFPLTGTDRQVVQFSVV